jgi:hypothetical protein
VVKRDVLNAGILQFMGRTTILFILIPEETTMDNANKRTKTDTGIWLLEEAPSFQYYL